jgi:hypothetical protein
VWTFLKEKDLARLGLTSPLRKRLKNWYAGHPPSTATDLTLKQVQKTKMRSDGLRDQVTYLLDGPLDGVIGSTLIYELTGTGEYFLLESVRDTLDELKLIRPVLEQQRIVLEELDNMMDQSSGAGIGASRTIQGRVGFLIDTNLCNYRLITTTSSVSLFSEIACM